MEIKLRRVIKYIDCQIRCDNTEICIGLLDESEAEGLADKFSEASIELKKYANETRQESARQYK